MTNGPTIANANDARLTLTTFGAARLSIIDSEGRDATLLENGKPLALIVYLACAPRRHAPRDSVIDLLWADLELDAARHALRQTLWHVKRRVADSLLIPNGDLISLAERVVCDRDAFLSAAAEDDIETVVQLYRGDFFPEFAAPGGAEFEKWADTERRYLRSAYQRSADALVRRHLSQGRFREAQDAARRLRNFDRDNEAGWRLLLEALLAGRDHAAAKLEADALQQLLASDERLPEAATRALIRLAQQPTTTSTDSDPKTANLVAELTGREREFSDILRAWDAVRLGTFKHFHLSAPAGLGKTRLLADAGARLRAMRARVVHVRAMQLSREIPYAFVGEIAAELCRLPGAAGVSPDSASALVALSPVVSTTFAAAPDRATGDEALRRRTIALRDLVAAVSEQNPLAILLDDLHWADSQSQRILASLIGSLPQQRTLIVTTSRPATETFFESESSTRLELSPLNETEVHAFVASIGALPVAPWTAWFVRSLTTATRGSPLLILETLHLLIERGVIALRERDWNAVDETALRDALQSESALAVRLAAQTDNEKLCLGVLAVSGIATSRELLSALLPTIRGELADILRGLEARGFVARDGEGWHLTHDEIARTVLAMLSRDQLAEAESLLGAHLLSHAGNDLSRIRRAALHLVRGRRQGLLTMAFIRFAKLLRSAGDRRGDAQLAGDLVNTGADAPEARTLAGALPFHMRLGLYTRQRQAALAGLVVVAGALSVAQAARGEAVPDAEVFVVLPGQPAAPVVRTPIWSAQWRAGEDLEVRRGRTVSLRLPADFAARPLVPQPGGNLWAHSMPVSLPDTGAMDVFVREENGLIQRLTSSRGDESSWSWSPDGRQIILSSGQWSRYGRYDVASVDIDTHEIRQLTKGEEGDHTPMSSPDGSKIGFIRRYWTVDVDSVCWVRADGLTHKCVTAARGGTLQNVGWRDNTHLLVTQRLNGDSSALIAVHTQSGESDLMLRGTITNAVASSDGRWVACYCQRRETDSPAWLAFPARSPERARHLVAGGAPLPRDARVIWRIPQPQYPDTLELLASPADALVGVPHKLALRARSNLGDSVSVSAVDWTLSDSSVATIHASTGVLVPRRTGRVDVTASLDGSRSATRPVVIDSRQSQVLFDEDWSAPIEHSWFAFGEPHPVVVQEPWGSALATNGDNNFGSGVHTLRAIPNRGGIAVDALVWVPLTLNQWQSLNVGVAAGLDTALATILQRATGDFEAWTTRPESICGLAYPAGSEGATRRHWLSLTAGRELTRIPSTGNFPKNKLLAVRLQVFPDGRCGVAVDGKPLLISIEPAIREDSVYVVLAGMSFETRITVGRLTVRSGVPNDIDWTLIPER